VLSSVRC